MKQFSVKLLLFTFLAEQLLFFGSFVAAANFHRDGNGPDKSSVILDGSVEGIDDGLFDANLVADQVQKSDVGKDSGDNVQFYGEGYINLTLSKLSFYLCSDCVGKVLICYESLHPDSSLKGDCPESSQCALQIEGIKPSGSFTGVIAFGPATDQTSYSKPGSSSPRECDVINLTGNPAKFKDSGKFKTCKPKIENGMIQIYVKPADDNTCLVEAVGAHIKYPKIITTPSPETSPKPINSTHLDSGEKTAESSLPWWGIMLICFALLALIICFGIAVYCFCFKRPSSKPAPTEISQPPTAIVTTNNVHESTLSKTIEAPPKSTKADSIVAVAKPEPSLSKEPAKKTVEKPEAKEPQQQKKPVEEKKVVEKKKHVKAKKMMAKTPEKKNVEELKKTTIEEEEKKTTVEPTTTTTEEPTPPKAAVEPPPKPSHAGYGCPTPHIVPKLPLQPRRTSSVEDVMEKNQAAAAKIAIESVQDSIRRNYLQGRRDGSVIVKKMKYYYPPYNHAILGFEIYLFCISISQMFECLNELVDGYEEALSGYGVEFDAEHRISKMTKDGRSYLQKLSTSGTTVLFAFGAEFHEYVTDDMGIMSQFSIPHLMAYALQPRFPEFHRRKACTYMRRQLPSIRAVYKAAHRENMPFPICMIEKAFEQEPKYLLDIASLDTDSESRRKDKAHEMVKMKENEGGRGGDGQKKKKKKSSKKRH